MIFPTTIVGSFPQPDWLIDREKLPAASRRACAPASCGAYRRSTWRQAQEDATLIAIRAQEAAGQDIISDGEIRRESYSNRFATALDGVDLDNPGMGHGPLGPPQPGARIVGPIRRRHAVEVGDLKFLRAHTDRMVRSRCPARSRCCSRRRTTTTTARKRRPWTTPPPSTWRSGPVAAGADVVQIDEPYMQARPEKARSYGLAALNRGPRWRHGHDRRAHLLRLRSIIHGAAQRLLVPARAGAVQLQAGVDRDRAVAPDCSALVPLAGKKVMVGCLDLSDPEVESVDTIVERIERALPYVAPENVILAPTAA